MAGREVRHAVCGLVLALGFPAVPAFAAPRLVAPPEGVSFGEIAAGEEASKSVELRNASAHEVAVSQVRGCCGAWLRLSRDAPRFALHRSGLRARPCSHLARARRMAFLRAARAVQPRVHRASRRSVHAGGEGCGLRADVPLVEAQRLPVQDSAGSHLCDPRRARPVRARRASRGYRWKGNVKVE